MRKIILAFIVCVVGHQGAGPRADRAQDGFVGPVKKVFVFWMPISGSNYPEGSKCRQMTNEYDATGRITRHSIYAGSCGGDELRQDYTYAPDGTKTTNVQDIRAPDSLQPPLPAFNPNAKPQTAPPKQIFKYDDAGRLIEDNSVKSDGQFSFKTTYTYDAIGRLTETATYDGLSRLTARRVYRYSGDERVPSEYVYYGRDARIYGQATYTDYEFNSQGDWIKRKETSETTFYLRDAPNTRRTVSVTHREIEYYPKND